MRIPTGFEQSLSHVNPIESHKTRHSPGFRCFVVPQSCFMLSVRIDGNTGVTSTHSETITDGSESRDQNHGPPWLGRGLTETGTNLVFRFLAELWERWRCLASLVCWNSSPWFVTNVHWSLSLIYWRGTQN